MGSERTVWRGAARVPGTCGELVQGFLAPDLPFHVTLPIERYSTARVTIEPHDRLEIVGLGPDKIKTRRALRLATEQLGLRSGRILVELGSELRSAKGMAASTADLVSVCAAFVAAWAREPPRLDWLARLACSVEVSDGVMFPGMVPFASSSGRQLGVLEWSPRFHVLAITPAGRLDTHRVDFTGKESRSPTFAALLSQLVLAARERHEEPFALAATRSAELNRSYVPNPLFDRLADRSTRELGALGVSVAHTGTTLGLLFTSSPAGSSLARGAFDLLRGELDPAIDLQVTRVERQGIRIATPSFPHSEDLH